MVYALVIIVPLFVWLLFRDTTQLLYTILALYLSVLIGYGNYYFTASIIVLFISFITHKDTLSRLFSNKVSIYLIFYIIVVTISMYINNSISFEVLLRYCFASLVIYAASFHIMERVTSRMLYICLISAAIISTLICTFPFYEIFIIQLNQKFSHYAAGLAGGIAAVCFYFTARYLNNKVIKTIMYLICSILLVMTFLTGARLQTIATLLVILISIRKVKEFIIVIFMLAIVLYLNINVSTPEREIAFNRFNRLADTSTTEYTFRANQIVDALQATIIRPIFGYGFNAWNRGMYISRSATDFYILTLHNSYALILYESGFLGLILYLVMLITAIRKGYRKNSNRILATSILLLYMIVGYGHSFLYMDLRVMYYLGIAAGMARIACAQGKVPSDNY